MRSWNMHESSQEAACHRRHPLCTDLAVVALGPSGLWRAEFMQRFRSADPGAEVEERERESDREKERERSGHECVQRRGVAERARPSRPPSRQRGDHRRGHQAVPLDMTISRLDKPAALLAGGGVADGVLFEQGLADLVRHHAFRGRRITCQCSAAHLGRNYDALADHLAAAHEREELGSHHSPCTCSEVLPLGRGHLDKEEHVLHGGRVLHLDVPQQAGYPSAEVGRSARPDHEQTLQPAPRRLHSTAEAAQGKPMKTLPCKLHGGLGQRILHGPLAPRRRGGAIEPRGRHPPASALMSGEDAMQASSMF